MIKNLDELFKAMLNNDPRILDQHGQWRSDLPTFGSNDFHAPLAWSWDDKRVIMGSSRDDLQIINRD